MCFVWIWEQTAIISLYNINWLVCITETECVYCVVRTEHLTFTNSTFCPHSVFMCFVWIWEQTAIISLYSINWLVCITETECVYCAVRTECLNVIPLASPPKSNALSVIAYSLIAHDMPQEAPAPILTRGFGAWQDLVRFVADKLAFVQHFPAILQLFPVSIIPSMLHFLISSSV